MFRPYRAKRRKASSIYRDTKIKNLNNHDTIYTGIINKYSFCLQKQLLFFILIKTRKTNLF